MRLRLLFLIVSLGFVVIPMRAQSPNCMTVAGNILSDQRNYVNTNPPYISSETVTWNVVCTNTNSGAVRTFQNAVTATGHGGQCGGAGCNFTVCDPIFGYAI